jgi:anti-anti-sigma factor
MGIVLESNEAGCLVTLDGSIDIASAVELKSALLDALSAGADVQVALGAATYIDITGIQLLWAASEQARLAGVGFHLAAEAPRAICSVLAEAGFPSFLASLQPV